MSSRQRRKRLSICSSSEEEDFALKTPDKEESCFNRKNTRSSERIKKKRNQSFRMPSRDDIWSNILPSKSPEKYYHLKPRKLINNFTKENNYYNYDPNCTSGSESMDDFIDDDLYEKKKKKARVAHRIKNRHKRVIQDSSSDSDTNQLVDKSRVEDKIRGYENNLLDKSYLDEGFGEENIGANDIKTQTSNMESNIVDMTNEDRSLNTLSCEVQKGNDLVSIQQSADTSDIETKSNEGVIPVKTKKKTSELDSDTDDQPSENHGSDTGDDSDIGKNRRKCIRRKSTFLDSEEDSDANMNSLNNRTNDPVIEENLLDKDDADNDMVVIETSDDDDDSFIVDDDDIDDSPDQFDDSDEPEHNGETSSDNESDSDSQCNIIGHRKNKTRVSMVQKRKKREELFDKFKEARKKRVSKDKCAKDDG